MLSIPQSSSSKLVVLIQNINQTSKTTTPKFLRPKKKNCIKKLNKLYEEVNIRSRREFMHFSRSSKNDNRNMSITKSTNFLSFFSRFHFFSLSMLLVYCLSCLFSLFLCVVLFSPFTRRNEWQYIY